MSLLNPDYNTDEGFKALLKISTSRAIPTPVDLDHVLDLARRAQDLEDVVDELEIIKKDYYSLFSVFEDKPDLAFYFSKDWRDFRTMVMQRYSGLYSSQLRTGDRIATDVFQRFYLSPKLNANNRTYGDDARPVTFIGPTGPNSYYTWPPYSKRPLGLINIPEGSVNNIWGWLALPHEVGHDIYVSVPGLQNQLESALESAMMIGSDNGDFAFPDVDYADGNLTIQLSAGELAALIWKRWANEAQADIVGLLNCGGAALMTLQQIIGFTAEDQWEPNRLEWDENEQDLVEVIVGPEVHPTSYIRNIVNIRALRYLGFNDFADELADRFDQLKPNADFIIWKLPSKAEVTRVPISEMEKSVDIAVSILLNHEFPALNDHSYRDIITFSDADQSIVAGIVEKLLKGDPFFDDDADPRHALAATVIALEEDVNKAETIHNTFIHFLGPNQPGT